MNHRPVVSSVVVLLALAFVFGLMASPVSASITPSAFNLVLTFPGATTASCGVGGHIAFDQSVTFGGSISHTQEATVTDGAGNVLFHQVGPTFSDGTYASYGSFTFAVAPTANPITAIVVYDGVAYTGSADIICLVYQGARIPSGFVLKTITCDVAVYDQPGGTAVGSNKVTKNQTWFVNPTSVKGPDGQMWTEIFVAGFTNAYVPASCVQ